MNIFHNIWFLIVVGGLFFGAFLGGIKQLKEGKAVGVVSIILGFIVTIMIIIRLITII